MKVRVKEARTVKMARLGVCVSLWFVRRKWGNRYSCRRDTVECEYQNTRT